MKSIEEQLAAPMDYKYRVQGFNKPKTVANCVAYIDARQVQQRLDDVFGVFGWQKRYTTINGNLYCEIGIQSPNTAEWVWKSDTGVESNVEKEKGEASDAFKRAAVNLGIGRFLYDLPIVKLNAMTNDKGYTNVVDENGRTIWDITKHIKSLSEKPVKPQVNSKPKAEPKQSRGTIQDCIEELDTIQDMKRFNQWRDKWKEYWNNKDFQEAGKIVKEELIKNEVVEQSVESDDFEWETTTDYWEDKHAKHLRM